VELKLEWNPEVIERGKDLNVGARLVQLTSAALISHDIYCEERYTSADGSRLAFLRSPLGGPPEQLWLCDLRTLEVACLSETIVGFPTSPLYGDSLFFARPTTSSKRVLTRVHLKTLEMDDVFDLSECPHMRWLVSSISPDERYYVSNFRVKGNIWGLYRVDLQRGTWEPFHEHKDICNPHPQFEPSRGDDILVQLNNGSIIDDEANIIQLVGEEGATLYAIDRDGGNERPLPVGKPFTGGVTGHECWVARTGKVLLSAADERKGALYLAAPGAKSAECLWKGLIFCHVAASNDGRYFIADCYSGYDVESLAHGKIYVGSMATCRMLPLCDVGLASAQFTHPHAYMTPDNRYVIFNSCRTGVGQVWAAEIPAGFLGALDDPLLASPSAAG
jgi:hypothetical protein